ncbi:hypothetical protein RFI_29646 [Reticulomyxa filosa]|uniref:Uncharacterized protein n=1 Tax=Reticulomyxa filosa TaxID=46433 RepID=X6M3Z0_RETFI|nr:hypothetical protein RFI_29646 [Reticulomyxa filosa]|eukprot:ETO07745.1 hypothetical protein RFI_29646 [Reticulomyxa filosa]
MEVGLSLCEFIQFERYAVQKLLHSIHIPSVMGEKPFFFLFEETLYDEENVEYLQLYRLVPLTNDIPKSYILYGENRNKNDTHSLETSLLGHSEDSSKSETFISKMKNRFSLSKAVTPLTLPRSSLLDNQAQLSANDVATDANVPKNSVNSRTSLITSQSLPNPRVIPFVTNTEELIEELREKAQQLYDKYILSDAPYAINISHDQRNDIMNFIAKKPNDDVAIWERATVLKFISAFDSCGIEMFRLLVNAFRRWKKTEQFSQLSEMIFLPH